MIWFGLVIWHINHCWLFNDKSSLYIYIKYIWFGLVLWHINHCRLFNGKSSLYIYVKYIWFGLLRFYGISTTVGYSMSQINLSWELLWPTSYQNRTVYLITQHCTNKNKKPEKLPVSMKYLQKYGRPGNSMTYFFDTATPNITQKQ